jgi:hypothetical protein
MMEKKTAKRTFEHAASEASRFREEAEKVAKLVLAQASRVGAAEWLPEKATATKPVARL